MNLSNLLHKPVGIIGAGSFGTAISNLIAFNTDVLLFSRRKEIVEQINIEHINIGVPMSPRVRATNDLHQIAAECTLIMPMVASASFRRMMHAFGAHLRPYHIIIHGTKGFDVDVDLNNTDWKASPLTRKNIKTMSEVIAEESVVIRVGCLSGPNLASEIIEGQPTATVIASKFEEVVRMGKAALDSKRFHVFGSNEILGAELSGALKNIIAIGSGILGGMGMGRNLQAMLITRGLTEMIYIGKALGSSSRAFLGIAGIGDLIATSTSTTSRNYTFGSRLAKGETPEQINASMPEVAEGIRTLQIARQLARTYKLHVPITEMLYAVVFEHFDIKRALDYLIKYPYDKDVDFL